MMLPVVVQLDRPTFRHRRDLPQGPISLPLVRDAQQEKHHYAKNG